MRGREIIDNISMAQEFVSYMGCKKLGGKVAIKLDMKQAFDKVAG